MQNRSRADIRKSKTECGFCFACRRIRPNVSVNPTLNADERFKPSDDKKIRRRVELRTDEEKIEWLKRKGEDAGFRLTDVRIKEAVANAAVQSSSKQFGRRGRDDKKMTFGSVVFEGILEVTDAEKFREALISGIGTGKAYGFGLLSVAKSA